MKTYKRILFVLATAALVASCGNKSGGVSEATSSSKPTSSVNQDTSKPEASSKPVSSSQPVSSSSAKPEPVALAAPTEMALNKGIITWNTVDHAASYTIAYNGGEATSLTEASYDASKDLKVGQNVFVIAALPEDGSEEYLKSAEATFTITGEKLANPVITTDSDEEGNYFTWECDDNADHYSYKLDGEETAKTTDTNKITPEGFGKHTLSLQAIASAEKTGETIYFDSDIIETTDDNALINRTDAPGGLSIDHGVLSFATVEGATGYKATFDGNEVKLDENRSADVSALLTVGKHEIKAYSLFGEYESDPETLSVEGKALPTPVVTVNKSEDGNSISWEAIEGASSYLVCDGETGDTLTMTEETTYAPSKEGNYSFTVKAIAGDLSIDEKGEYLVDGAASEKTAKTTFLSKPVITVKDQTFSFSSVTGAASYKLFSDGEEIAKYNQAGKDYNPVEDGTYTDTALHELQVKAYDEAGNVLIASKKVKYDTDELGKNYVYSFDNQPNINYIAKSTDTTLSYDSTIRHGDKGYSLKAEINEGADLQISLPERTNYETIGGMSFWAYLVAPEGYQGTGVKFQGTFSFANDKGITDAPVYNGNSTWNVEMPLNTWVQLKFDGLNNSAALIHSGTARLICLPTGATYGYNLAGATVYLDDWTYYQDMSLSKDYVFTAKGNGDGLRTEIPASAYSYEGGVTKDTMGDGWYSATICFNIMNLDGTKVTSSTGLSQQRRFGVYEGNQASAPTGGWAGNVVYWAIDSSSPKDPRPYHSGDHDKPSAIRLPEPGEDLYLTWSFGGGKEQLYLWVMAFGQNEMIGIKSVKIQPQISSIGDRTMKR